MPLKIAVFNRKGGVGKTTLSIILTQIALKKERKVLAIDQDEQCNFSQSIRYLKDEKAYQGKFTLKTILTDEDINHPSDIMIIDCPPSFNENTRRALRLADMILIPVRPDYYSIWQMNMQKIRAAAGEYKEAYQFPLVKIGFTSGGVKDKSVAAKDASRIIADGGYAVIADLPLSDTIAVNISSDRHKWWSVGLRASTRQIFDVMYRWLEWRGNMIVKFGSKKEQKEWPKYDFSDD